MQDKMWCSVQQNTPKVEPTYRIFLFQNEASMIDQRKQRRLEVLLSEAVRDLCCQELESQFTRDLRVRGVLGVTLDGEDLVLVDIEGKIDLQDSPGNGNNVSICTRFFFFPRVVSSC